MGLCLKVNVIARQEFELAYYDIAVQHISHDDTLNQSLRCILAISHQTSYI